MRKFKMKIMWIENENLVNHEQENLEMKKIKINSMILI